MSAVSGDAAALRARVHDALVELRDLRCSDHAASAAIDAVRLTERTLAEWWAPTLDPLLRPDQ